MPPEKLSRILITFLFCSIGCLANSQSQFTPTNLEILCKAWGIIKYNHPTVQTGKHNLDAFLLQAFRNLEKGETPNQIVEAWLNISGDPKAVDQHLALDLSNLSSLEFEPGIHDEMTPRTSMINYER